MHESWNWEPEKRLVADLGALREEHPGLREPVVSPDGERIAAAVVQDDDAFVILENGEPWGEETFERAWSLRYGEDGRLSALVRLDDEWTVAVDREPWEERFDFAWNVLHAAGGASIAVQTKSGTDYGVCINGEPWENGFLSCRGMSLSPDGKRAAAVVQLEEVPEADIWKFFEGTWSVAVDGEAWDRTFINVYAPTFTPDGSEVAAEVRTDLAQYTLAVGAQLWEQQFGMVWEPAYRPGAATELLVPARLPEGWTVCGAQGPQWNGRYFQLWHLRFCADGSRLAAVVAPSYGRWTVAVDDRPWGATWGDLVLPPVLSPDGQRVAAVVKDAGLWDIAVDGNAWGVGGAMAWDPVFSPDGSHVAAHVEKDGKHHVLLDGRPLLEGMARAWDPIFSPDGGRVLVRGVSDDSSSSKYYRQVVSV